MDDRPATTHGTEAGCLIRLYWMFIGNVAVVFALGLLFDRRPRFPALLDLAVFAAVAALVAARFVDIRHYHGETGEGRPATMAQWRRYAVSVAGAGAAAWVLVRLLILMGVA